VSRFRRGLTRLTSWRLVEERVSAAILALIVGVVHLLCLPSQALTDDDDFYAPAGIRAADWLFELVTSPSSALSSTGIDAAFAINHEHPPVAKYAFGLAHHLTHGAFGWYGALDGARVGTVVFVVVLVWIMVRWLWVPLGPLAAVTSVVMLVTMPRFFVHSEVATLDVPVAVMVFVTAALFERARDRLAAGVVVGVVFGLAAATKLNAPFAILPCLALVVAERWRGVALKDADRTSPTATLFLPTLPPSLWAMVIVGPLVFVLVWPWLWPDPIARLSAYLAFHLRHYPIYLFFEGEIWEQPFAPGRASVIMAVGSVPVVTVVAASVGALIASRAAVDVVRSAGQAESASRRERVLTLCLLQAAMSLGVVAVSDVPRYGGEKLFLPLFPFLAVLAGVGVSALVDGLQRLFARRRWAAVVVVAVCAGPGGLGVVSTFGGFGLSYYGEAVGGLRGAVARGYERTYYDMADKTLARFLDEHAAGLAVHVAPNHKEYVRTWRWLRKDGVLRRGGFAVEANIDRADVVVLTHERRWITYPALRERLRGWPILAEHRVDGVPLWTVYRRPLPPG
jgi:hypothetical protein